MTEGGTHIHLPDCCTAIGAPRRALDSARSFCVLSDAFGHLTTVGRITRLAEDDKTVCATRRAKARGAVKKIGRVPAAGEDLKRLGHAQLRHPTLAAAAGHLSWESAK